MAEIAKLIGVRGAIGIVVALILSTLLVVQKGETRHWHKQSDQWQQKYEQEHLAFGQTVLNYREAAAKAKAADKANAERVAAEQSKINQERYDALQTRLADARAEYQRLRAHAAAAAAAHPGSSAGAPVPCVSAAASGPNQAACKDGLPLDDALTATEQSIQLDEIIKWVNRQHAVDANGSP